MELPHQVTLLIALNVQLIHLIKQLHALYAILHLLLLLDNVYLAIVTAKINNA
jgi:hypothetical protein